MVDEFKSWEDMTILEQYQCQYWDMYKDAYGFRPHGIDTSSWTEQDFEKEFEYLSYAIRREDEARRMAEEGAVRDFENRVGEMVALGAGNRETALRWIMEADQANGDWEFLCYLNGLPYGFFNPTKPVN